MTEIDVLLGIVLGLISFGIGSSLQFWDFVKIIRYPRSLTIGLVMQMVFLPLFAFILIYFTNLSMEWKLGIFILSLCPGGTTSNFISYLLNLETALSVLLTSINSFLILITIPLGLKLFSNYYTGDVAFSDLSLTNTLFQVLAVVILPAFLGLLLNRYYPNFSKKIQKGLKTTNSILLASVFLFKFLLAPEDGGTGLGWHSVKAMFFVLLTMHLGSIIISYLLSKRIIKNKRVSITIGVEVGLQNTVLALFIASTLSDNGQVGQPALLMAGFSFFTTFLFAYLTKRFADESKAKEL